MNTPSTTVTPPTPEPSGEVRPHYKLLKLLRIPYFVLCNTLLLCILVEVGWRVGEFSKGTQSEESALSVRNVPYTLHPFFQTTYRPDSDTLPGPFLAGWRADPSEFAETPGRKRVMFLGGLTTASLYPHLVRLALDREVGPTTIYNLGFEWHCSLHSLYKFWTYQDEVHSDLVVVLDNINDFYRGFTAPDTSLEQYRPDYSHSAGALFPFWMPGRSRFDQREVFYARPTGRFEGLEANDPTLRGLAKTILRDSEVLHALGFSKPRSLQRGQEVVSMPESVYLRSLPAFERNMRNLARSCEQKGVPVLFLTMPFTIGSGHTYLLPGNFFTNDGMHHLGPEQFAAGMRRFNDVVRSLANEPTVCVVDVAVEIVDPALFTDEVHLTEQGQLREAQLVSNAILQRQLLNARAK